MKLSAEEIALQDHLEYMKRLVVLCVKAVDEIAMLQNHIREEEQGQYPANSDLEIQSLNPLVRLSQEEA